MDLKDQNIAEIKSWLQTLSNAKNLSDEQIKIFLHSCYDDIKATKHCINEYLSAREHLPEIFSNRDPIDPKIQSLLKYFEIILPSEKTDENYSVILIRCVDSSTEHFDMNMLFKCYFMTVDALMLENPLCEGLQLVFDVTGSTLGHMWKMNTTTLRKCIKYLEEGMPVRIKAMHVVNLTFVMIKLIQLLKSFLHDDRSEMTYFHSSSSIESLHAYVPPKCLPQEYGGTLGPSKILNENNLARLIKHRDYFLHGPSKGESGEGCKTLDNGPRPDDDSSLEKLHLEE